MGGDSDESLDHGRVSERAVPPQLSDDQFYRALAAVRRRRLLAFLLSHRESTVDELAAVLAGWALTAADTMATLDDYERIRIGLEHVHLPLLADAGLVTYDRESGTVRLEELAPSVRELLTRAVAAEAETPSRP